MDYGLWFMDCDLWILVYVIMDYDLWIFTYGLWTMMYGL